MRHRLFKSLRIAVTAVSLFVCALLIVLWVRSYATTESTAELCRVRLLNFGIECETELGIAEIRVTRHPPEKMWSYKRIYSDPFGEWPKPWLLNPNDMFLFSFTAPSWFWLTITATIAALPWIKWRFSLRTLLIVLTLFAVFFGAIAMSL